MMKLIIIKKKKEKWCRIFKWRWIRWEDYNYNILGNLFENKEIKKKENIKKIKNNVVNDIQDLTINDTKKLLILKK